MLKKCVRVELPSGLEARPAAMLGFRLQVSTRAGFIWNQMGNG